MHVAFVLEAARIDGTVRFFARQCEQLRRRGHSVVVMCAGGSLEHTFGEKPVLLEALSPGGPALAAQDVRRITRACEGADLVVTVAGRAFPAAFAAVDAGRVVLDLLSNDLFCGDDPQIVAAVRAAARNGRIVAHTPVDGRAHASRYGFDPRDVVYVGLPVERPQGPVLIGPALRHEPGEAMILTAARLDDEHIGYIAPLVADVEKLNRGGVRCRLAIVGDGRHAGAVAKPASGVVDILGPRTDLDALYPLADLYVGEGSSRLEAVLAGVPVISSCAQEQPELAARALFLYGMQHGTLHAYSPSSAIRQESFADAIALLLNDQALCQRVVRRGACRVRSVHGPEGFVRFLEGYVLGTATRGTPALDPCARVINVPNERDMIVNAVDRCCAGEADGITIDGPFSWQSYAALPERVWDGLADLSRRATFQAGTHSASPMPVRPNPFPL